MSLGMLYPFATSLPGFMYTQLFSSPPPPPAPLSLASKTILLTGASSGIGLATAQLLHSAGATLHLTVRTASQIAPTLAALGPEACTNTTQTRIYVCDHASLASVRAFLAALPAALALDAAILNAGVSPTTWTTTPDGVETALQVNFLVPALLSLHLLPHLRRRQGTLVAVTSEIHAWTPFAPQYAPRILDCQNDRRQARLGALYSDTKTLGLLWMLALARHETAVTVTTVTPGFCASGLLREMDEGWVVSRVMAVGKWMLARSTADGARGVVAPVIAADREGGEKGHGGYWVDGGVAGVGGVARDEWVAERVWREGVEWVERLVPGVVGAAGLGEGA
ncbi:hypothetical protein EDC01DRAFT_509214 [Geopyxis carbonaria]|nr:hypothetical protein EDC01DRAFT_509214 [Geopyxis carbonaria]